MQRMLILNWKSGTWSPDDQPDKEIEFHKVQLVPAPIAGSDTANRGGVFAIDAKTNEAVINQLSLETLPVLAEVDLRIEQRGDTLKAFVSSVGTCESVIFQG